MKLNNWIRITDETVVFNGEKLPHETTGNALLTELYRNHIGDYPKFFKMDALCKLGFVASELLLGKEENRFAPREDRAIVFFNRSGSLNADTHFQATIQDKENYFPSPAVFVYTLPNIVTGEIAIRNKYYGETSFIVMEQNDPQVMARQLQNAFLDADTKSILGGWINCDNDNRFDACLFIINENQFANADELTENIMQIINNQ